MKRKALILNSVKKGQFYVQLIGDNGKNLNPAEPHENKRDCIKVLKKYFPDFRIVEETLSQK